MNYFKRLFQYINQNKESRYSNLELNPELQSKNRNGYMDSNEIERLYEKQRKKDKIDKLVKKNGFHMKSYGRCGTIYYVKNGKLCEIEYELSTDKYDKLNVFFDSTTEWILPEETRITEEERLEINEELNKWIIKKKLRKN